MDYSNDEDHNRLVVTVVGEPEALKDALLEAIGQAVELIDLTKHSGQHPRMGAVDVVPFIPIRGCTMDEAIALSKEVGEKVAALYRVPVFLYEKSASAPHRENLAAIRKGEFEGMEAKIKQPEWKPDFGPAERHPSAGTVAIGARMPLVAYNVNLGTANLEIASSIAKKDPLHRWRAPLLQGDGSGTERTRHRAGFDQYDRLYPHRPFIALSSWYALSTSLWCPSRRKRDYWVGSDGGVD